MDHAYLDVVFYFHVSQEFSIDAEHTEVAFVVINDAVTLSGGQNQTRQYTAVRTLQSPQQIAVHGVDETRTLCSHTHIHTCMFTGLNLNEHFTDFYSFIHG